MFSFLLKSKVKRRPSEKSDGLLSLPVAKRRGNFVHQKAVLPEAVGCCLTAANVERGDRGGFGHAAQDNEPVGGEFARVFGRGVVFWWQGVRERLDKSRQRLGLKPPEGLFLARRDKARNRYHTAAGLLDDLVDRFAVFFDEAGEGLALTIQQNAAPYGAAF